MDKFRDAQDADVDLQVLRECLESLKIQPVPISSARISLWCDISTSKPRPIVLYSLRHLVFDKLHQLSHPGVAATRHLVADRYVWPSLNKDVEDWVRSCIPCQKSKIHWHASLPIGVCKPPSTRFDKLQIDLVGPLPPSHGQCYILTCIDRFTRWP